MRALLLLGATAACVPSRAALFDPVAEGVHGRIGVRPGWGDPGAEKRARELLAAPLTADSAALVAVLGNGELQEAYAELGVLGGELAEARTPGELDLDAEAAFGEGETHVELAAIHGVSDLLLMIPRGRAADARLRAGRRRAVALTIELAARARVAFYDAAAAELRLALRRVIVETADAGVSFARGLYDAGNLTDLELAREEVFAEEAALELRDAEAEAQATRETLNEALGLSGADTGWTLAALAAVPERATAADDLERAAIEASLDLDAARWELEAAGQDIGAARIASFPRLGAGVSVRREEGTWEVGPALRLSLPIWSWGRGERAAAWSRLRGRQAAYRALGVTIRAEARAAAARLASAHERARRLQTRVLPLRERLMEESVKQYNAMNVTTFELLEVRREQIEAQERYIDALRDYWVAAARADALRAGALPGRGHEEREP
jgi:cobalt-zinc-cadmium efflux system outer membrane protein